MANPPIRYLVRAAEVGASSHTHSHPWNPLSHLHGMRLSTAVGLQRTGVSFVRNNAARR
jgi:hypothetical protein